ncbi:hypothetical protein [uncultured Methanobrevibacter sp.]|uniref:hypothetical protein n=1 Tax=uncultured Methanobrevibacter sp. TaxID=253161 RepID=UPI002637ED69
MKIVTTPMCKKIVEWAGLKDFNINKHPSLEDGDFAILLSESKVEMDSLAIKLNTFLQIRESIMEVSKLCFENDLIDSPITDSEIDEIFLDYSDLTYANLDKPSFDEIKKSNSNKNVKVYSEFLKDIVRNLGANIIDFSLNSDSNLKEEDFEYIVYPDYLEDIVLENEDLDNNEIILIKVLTHSNVSKNPIERAEQRYSVIRLRVICVRYSLT